ncbi:hypothetical protein GCM10010954_29500 [Halobacillus andaensis]|uniref:Uncharacterized protein n=1 Tax=Halobacillus andaensis TaxID=1176239 RepID=A0A917B6X5_HALAA|nr:hypothetical protein [Halobacillus andaensis]MBP2005055.1 hypothetical protein [Halobacillus andaensis]GGF28537.1 hypothetical protein GCM10010954_29500 [Halobacillus andaensis]
MTMHFFIFTIRVTRRKKQNYSPLPGYRHSAHDQWLDRKASAKTII